MDDHKLVRVGVVSISAGIFIWVSLGFLILQSCSNAKYFDDENYIIHKEDLEKKYIKRKEPEFFI